ncbi:MAG TPA: ABC transporter permease, partial [Blastocatellia bacterium]
MKTLFADLRYCFRTLIKTPGFTAVAVLSIALGIGANTAVFSLVNAVLFKPLPVDRPDRLAALYVIEPESSFPDSFSYPDYVDYRDKCESFSHLVGHYGTTLNIASAGQQPELVWGELVTGNYFTGLGVSPALGRLLTDQDDINPGAHPVAVLSHSFWQRRFNSDPQIAGKTIRLNGHDFTITGVASFGFSGTRFLGYIPDIWMPVAMHGQILNENEDRLHQRGWRWMNVNGRMKEGVALEQAGAEMNLIAGQLADAYPQTDRDIKIKITSAAHKTQPLPGGDNILTFLGAMMMGVVGLVLLIVCANVANLLLARATARRREIAIRLAMGASRWRLIRQLLTESIALSVAGGALGLAAAAWLIDLFKTSGPELDFSTVNPDYDFSIDHRVFLFALALSVITGIIFGLLPALQASKPDLVSTLKGETQTFGARRLRLRNALVVAQVALSLVLLVSAGLFVRSLENANKMNPGFDTRDILIGSVHLGVQGYTEKQGREFYKRLLERAQTIPGVESASLAASLPLDDGVEGAPVFVEGYTPRSETEKNTVLYTVAGPKYFETMGTEIIQGRAFDEHDDEKSPRVVVINETMARLYWPGQSPIGKRLQLNNQKAPFLEVIGVAADGKYITLGEEQLPYMFVPLWQSYESRVRILLRSKSDTASLAAGLRQEVQALDQSLALFGVKTIQQFLQRSLWGADTVAVLVGSLGVLALLLAAVGLYGLMSYSVSQRTREIGIRMALGADRSNLLRMIVGQGL